jgi:transposase
MNITTVGIDLAKNVFQVHGVDARGKLVLRRQLRREQVARFFVKLPSCLVGMESCASAHHWGRTLERFGHTVRLMAPQFVKPYVEANKNDVADAEAICEAMGRPNMRFVPIKSIEQQGILSVHRVRQVLGGDRRSSTPKQAGPGRDCVKTPATIFYVSISAT